MTDFDRLDVLVLAGGISHERDVSLRSGRRVADALSRAGHHVTVREPDSTLLDFIRDSRPDVVWPALHGASGEDGALRALLEFTGVPFVGSLTDAARLSWSKPNAKAIVARDGVPTPRSITLPRETFRELGANTVLSTIATELGERLVVKPAQGGSAQGVSLVDDSSELPRAMVDAYTYSDVALIEQRIDGVEVSVAVLQLDGGAAEALPIVEIQPVEGAYTFAARYNAGETRFFVPARLSEESATQVAELAVRAHYSLGLRHLSRIDFMVDAAGTPFFLEANVLPGLTETSILPQAVEAAGRGLGDVYAQLAISAVRDAERA